MRKTLASLLILLFILNLLDVFTSFWGQAKGFGEQNPFFQQLNLSSLLLKIGFVPFTFLLYYWASILAEKVFPGLRKILLLIPILLIVVYFFVVFYNLYLIILYS